MDIDSTQVVVQGSNAQHLGRGVQLVLDLDHIRASITSTEKRARERTGDAGDHNPSRRHRKQWCTFRQRPVIAAVSVSEWPDLQPPPCQLITVVVDELERQIMVEEIVRGE